MSKLQGLRILIAEDDTSLLKVETIALTRKGSIVFGAVNGKEALAILEKETVDIVLSDIQMPVVDGLELLERIRKSNPILPIVLFVTGQAQVDESQSISLGASGLIQKPVKLKDLIARIEDLFKDITASPLNESD